MADPIGTCPNCNRPVFGSERRCFCGFDLRPTIAGWQRQREELAELERDRAKAAEETARQQQAEAERQRAQAQAEAEAQRQRDEAAKNERTAAARAEAERQRAQARAEAEAQRQRDEATEAEHAAAARAEAEHQRTQTLAEAEAQRQRDKAAENERATAAARAEAERQRAKTQAEAEAQRQRDEAAKNERAAASAEAERRRTQAQAEAEAQSQRDEAAAREQAAKAEEQRRHDTEAERQRAADAETQRQRDAQIAAVEARLLAQQRADADSQKPDPQPPPVPGIWSGLRLRPLLMAGGVVVMILGGLFTALSWWDSPPQPAGMPIATPSGMVLGRLHGLPRVDAGRPTPHAVVATGEPGRLVQHPLDALHLGPSQIITELTPDQVAQLPRAEGPLATGFDLAGFLASRPDAKLVEERAAQMAATGDWALARLLLRWASEGNPRAGTALGRLYDPNFAAVYPTPFPPDPSRAVSLYERAAAAGDTAAAGLLGTLRTQMAQRPGQPPRQPPDQPSPPSPPRSNTEAEAQAQAGLARVTIAKGTTLGLEISRGWHRIEALRLLIAGVRAEASGDPGLAANMPAYEARLRAETASLEQQVTAYLGTLRELQAMPPDLLQRQAQVVATDPAYAGAAMAQATDTLLAQVRGIRDQPSPDRERLLRDIVQNQ